MRFPLEFVCLGIFLNAFLTRTAECILILKDRTLAGPYTGQEAEISKNWFLMNSVITPNFIQLTPEKQHVHGAIWSAKPFMSKEWEFQVNFRIYGSRTNIFGRGIALWYVKEPRQVGPVFGSKDYFSGLGVFIDTTSENPAYPHNHLHPYISAMVNNGSVAYRHDEDGTFMQLGECYGIVRNVRYQTRLAVAYTQNTLVVYADTEGEGKWKTCFASLGVHLPTGYYFGISANTDERMDNHQIISVTTLDMAEPDKEPVEVEDRSGIVPRAENIVLPEKFKELLDEEMDEEKSVREQPRLEPPKVEAPKIEVKKPDRFIIPKEMPEEEIPKEKVEKIREKEKRKAPPIPDVVKVAVEDVEVQEWSWTLKACCLLVIVVLVFYMIKCWKNYRAQRKVMREKRLY